MNGEFHKVKTVHQSVVLIKGRLRGEISVRAEFQIGCVILWPILAWCLVQIEI